MAESPIDEEQWDSAYTQVFGNYAMDVFLWTTEEVFHALGKVPDRIDVFITFVTPGVMLTFFTLCFVSTNVVTDMPSGPLF